MDQEGLLAGGNGNPLQHPCWDNPRDRGAWRATGLGVLKSQTRLSSWVRMPTQCHSQPAPGPYSPIWDPYSELWLCLTPGWGWSLHLNKGPHDWMIETRETVGSAIIPSYKETVAQRVKKVKLSSLIKNAIQENNMNFKKCKPIQIQKLSNNRTGRGQSVISAHISECLPWARSWAEYPTWL